MDDIYGDLDNYNYNELLKENETLKAKLNEKNCRLEKLEEEFDSLKKEHERFQTRYSSLLKTAKAELKRKTQMITNLNAEKDQIIIQYLSNTKNRYPFSAKNNSNQQIKKADTNKAQDEETRLKNNNQTEKKQITSAEKTVKVDKDRLLDNKKHKENHHHEGPERSAPNIECTRIENKVKTLELRKTSSPQVSSDGEIPDDESTSAKSSRKSEIESGGGDYRKRSSSPNYHDDRGRMSYHRSRHSRHYDNIESRDSLKNNRSKSRRRRSRDNYEQKDYYKRDYDKSDSKTDFGRSGRDRNMRRGESPSRETYRNRAKSREYRINEYRDNDRYNEQKEKTANKHKIDYEEYVRNKKMRSTEEPLDPFANTVYKKLDEASNPFHRLKETIARRSRSKSRESHNKELSLIPQIECGSAALKENTEDRSVGARNVLDDKDFVPPPLIEDPRLISKKYVEVKDAKNIVHITRASEANFDLKTLKFYDTLKHVPATPKSCLDIGEINTNERHMSIDIQVQNLSGESSNEINKILNEKKKGHVVSKTTITDTPMSPDTTSLSLIRKYKILKKSKCDNVAHKIVKPVEIREVEESNVRKSSRESCETKIGELKEKNENKTIIKNVSGEVDVLRMEDDDPYHLEIATLKARQQMIEGDLELSDENSNDSINLKTKDDVKVCLPTFGKNLHQETPPEIDKVKDIKSKFTDLFGETSLITPEDLDLCPKPEVDVYDDANSAEDVEEAIIDVDLSKSSKKLTEKDTDKINETVEEHKLLRENNKIKVPPESINETSEKESVKDKLPRQDKCDKKSDYSESNTPNVLAATNELEPNMDTLETTKISPIVLDDDKVTTVASVFENSTPEVKTDLPKADVTLVLKRRRNILRKPNPI